MALKHTALFVLMDTQAYTWNPLSRRQALQDPKERPVLSAWHFPPFLSQPLIEFLSS